MMTKIFLLALASVLIAVNATPPVISLLESNVDVNYDVAAVNTLGEAYNLYPTAEEESKRLESFSELFGETYKMTGGWNVASGCALVYLPNKPKSVTLQVIEDGATEAEAKIIRIFSNQSS